MTRIHSITLLLMVFAGLPLAMRGQVSASLSGSIVERMQAPVSGATVRLHSAGNGVSRTTVTGRDGLFHFDDLRAGIYTLECAANGFQTVKVPALTLHERTLRTMTVELTPNSTAASPRALDEHAQGISVNPGSETTVDAAFARILPLSGRNLVGMVPLAPGVVSTVPAAGMLAGGSPQLFVNGLRWNTNNFLIDGVSANAGTSVSTVTGYRGLGAGDWIASMDATQETRIETAPMTATFGRSAGAQVLVSSRSGGNETHGSLFGSFRPDGLKAGDWMANAAGVESAEMRYRQFGATLGGALQRDRTFYFLSYERLWANLPQTSSMEVPDLATRTGAIAALQPYVNAFPLANGASSGNGTGRFTASTAAEQTAQPFSVRLDHRFGETASVFARYSEARGDSLYRGTGWLSPVVTTDLASRNRQVTGGITWSATPRVTNDLRGSYSRQHVSSFLAMDGLGGATPLDLSSLLPAGISADDAFLQWNVAGMGSLAAGKGNDLRRDEVHVVNALTVSENRHTFQMGVDYRRLFATIYQPAYGMQATFNGLKSADGSLLSGYAAGLVVSGNEWEIQPVASNFSFYAQDTWRMSERTTAVIGFRWEVNPPPGIRSGPALITYDGAAGVDRFRSFYQTKKSNLAPRLGLAYRLDTTPGRELIFRVGGGVFYEPGYGNVTEYFGGAPFSAKRILGLAAFPLTTAIAALPGLPEERPYGQVNGADPYLVSPRILQWNAAFEKMLGGGQSLTLSYVGTSGRNLLATETQGFFNSTYSVLRVMSNNSESDYRGLQLQYRQRGWRGLSTQLSYTWAHSLDTLSEDYTAVLPGFVTHFGTERGNSDFDVKHALSMAGSYRFPNAREGMMAKLLRDWHADWMLFARSGLPFDIQTVTPESSDTDDTLREDEPGLYALVRANYMGLPVWISDATAPDGKRLSADAFQIPTSFTQGTLGRNALRGFGMWQLDLALRREVVLSERLRLHLMAQALNAFNHANFANPSSLLGGNLASTAFGGSTGTIGSSMGGGLSQLYGQSGPRTIQFGVRMEF